MLYVFVDVCFFQHFLLACVWVDVCMRAGMCAVWEGGGGGLISECMCEVWEWGGGGGLDSRLSVCVRFGGGGSHV